MSVTSIGHTTRVLMEEVEWLGREHAAHLGRDLSPMVFVHPELDCLDEMLQELVVLIGPSLHFDVGVELQLFLDVAENIVRCVRQALEPVINLIAKYVVDVQEECSGKHNRQRDFLGFKHGTQKADELVLNGWWVRLGAAVVEVKFWQVREQQDLLLEELVPVALASPIRSWVVCSIESRLHFWMWVDFVHDAPSIEQQFISSPGRSRELRIFWILFAQFVADLGGCAFWDHLRGAEDLGLHSWSEQVHSHVGGDRGSNDIVTSVLVAAPSMRDLCAQLGEVAKQEVQSEHIKEECVSIVRHFLGIRFLKDFSDVVGVRLSKADSGI
ncbi:hypothetical protein BU23DRAFT_601044 [Bimuria novae-zelandiae CBS 107.79]|uniref:Uncharacterized protein n=1 Tax=Bimuria novae-zelandiae CBS 107.79 TaxID=1447943 RepID=A0A6A5V0Y9_9PLEO|nr:hypothetical protein BU23DRAFT_601044 [Bimuria novae-zelandiae CBS 107.79]